MALPIHPPFPPMEAKAVAELPKGDNWAYEPKWDGFRCLAFRKGSEVLLQSKAGQPLGRYFPEMVEALAKLPVKQFVLDGEIVILRDGRLSFDDLLLRIHPAESRIRKLSKETPASYLVFDLLVDERGKVAGRTAAEREAGKVGRVVSGVWRPTRAKDARMGHPNCRVGHPGFRVRQPRFGCRPRFAISKRRAIG